MKLKQYPKTKDSGFEWLQQVPEHWELKKLRTVLKPNNRRNRQDLPLLSVVREKGIILRNVENKEENNNYIPDDLSNYKVVSKDQFVINKMKSWQGSYGISKYDGIVSPAYYIFDCHGVVPQYFHIAMRSRAYVPFFTQASDGVRVGQWDLSINRMKEIPFAVPSIDEQFSIVSYLKAKEKKIAQFINNKRRLIQLLKEQKQAIINQAVTRGINPDVKMKPSGVDWLGDVPEHWEVKRLKMLYCNVADQTSSKETDDIYIALEHVESWTGKLNLPSEEIPFESQVKKFYPNDILFGKLRPYLAKVFKPNCKGVCGSEFLVLRDYSNEVLPEFMELKLRSNQIIDLINSSTFGAKMPRADWNFIGNILFSYPTKDEQKSIIEKLVIYIRQRDVLIEKAEKEIELIQEYRARLISDVVTGKVDVRDIKVEDVTDEEITDDLDSSEDEQELNDGGDSVEELWEDE